MAEAVASTTVAQEGAAALNRVMMGSISLLEALPLEPALEPEADPAAIRTEILSARETMIAQRDRYAAALEDLDQIRARAILLGAAAALLEAEVKFKPESYGLEHTESGRRGLSPSGVGGDPASQRRGAKHF